MSFCGVSLEDALACATILPARVVGIDSTVGSLEPGKLADAVICRGDGNGIRLTHVIRGGEIIVGRG